MKLTPFGETIRVLRMRYDVSMKAMADALGISSSYMSGIEYGEKTLADKYVDGAVKFFEKSASAQELSDLLKAAQRSKEVVNVSDLEPDARVLVAAFARRLQDGAQPTDEISEWLENSRKGNRNDTR
jgi:transcriptional regulator with XRE-family HTH domain